MALNDNPVIKSTYSCSLGKVRKLTTLRITLFFYGVWGGSPCQCRSESPACVPQVGNTGGPVIPWSHQQTPNVCGCPVCLQVSPGLCDSSSTSIQTLSGSGTHLVSTQHVSVRTLFPHNSDVIYKKPRKTNGAFMQILFNKYVRSSCYRLSSCPLAQMISI